MQNLKERFERDGYVFPLTLMSSEEASACRQEYEELERRHAATSGRAKMMHEHSHLLLPVIDRIARHPVVLDAVEEILGPDLLIWNCSLFEKAPRSPHFVGWHQDLTYWGLSSTKEVTAWFAMTPATPETGCMRFLPGSHKNALVDHKQTFSDTNLLSRGQEIAVEVDESEAVSIVLRPGQMSLHHGHMFHASGPNQSGDRRLGFAIRYITPDVEQVIGERDYAVLARGEDRFGHFVLLDPPSEPFPPATLEKMAQITADGDKIFYAGVDPEVRAQRR